MMNMDFSQRVKLQIPSAMYVLYFYKNVFVHAAWFFGNHCDLLEITVLNNW